MMTTATHGRLGLDPRRINTKSGKPMAVASLAVDIAEAGEPLWLGLVAFGRLAEDLLRHAKGDVLAVSGQVQRKTWTDRNGETRESLQIVADSLVSAQNVRPRGGQKRTDRRNDCTVGEFV